MIKELCGQITYEGGLYNVFWNPNDGIVWYGLVGAQNDEINSKGQTNPVLKEQAIDIALQMLKLK